MVEDFCFAVIVTTNPIFSNCSFASTAASSPSAAAAAAAAAAVVAAVFGRLFTSAAAAAAAPSPPFSAPCPPPAAEHRPQQHHNGCGGQPKHFAALLSRHTSLWRQAIPARSTMSTRPTSVYCCHPPHYGLPPHYRRPPSGKEWNGYQEGISSRWW